MSESIRAVERALEVLLCFSSQTPELSMTQISEKVGINKSTVHRLLATLERNRFVERNPVTGIYKPGVRLLQMAFLTLEHNDLRRLAAPFLKQLCDMYSENVNLSILDDTEVVYIDIVESTQRVKLAASPGQRLPAFCTASGKAIMAFMPSDKVYRILDGGMTKFTNYTITLQDEFIKNIKLAKDRGFAFSEQEFEEGINAVAAPIIGKNDEPIASVSIAGPAYRLTLARMMKIGPSLVAATRKIAQEIEMVADLK